MRLSTTVKEEDEDEEETYFARDFEKKFFSDETNMILRQNLHG
jgi:hypothetical protein